MVQWDFEKSFLLNMGVHIYDERMKRIPRWQAREHDSEWPFDLLATNFKLRRSSTALLVIDMQDQALLFSPKSKMAKRYPAVAAYSNARVTNTVIPNIRLLIELFRARRRKIIYTRNGNVTSTGAEMTDRLRKHVDKFQYPRRTRNCGIDLRLAPRKEDLIIDKLTSSAFTASFLDHALRNMGIQSVVITGVVTDMCVLGTARGAAELGYDSLICEDACGALTERSHQEALLIHARTFGRVATTAEVIRELAANA